MEAAGGIRDDQVGAAGDGRIERVVHDGPRIRAGRVGDHRHLRPVRPDPQLVDRRGAERVGRCQQDRPPLPGVAARQLPDRGRLARAVDTDDQDDRGTAGNRRARAPVEVSRHEERRELGPDGRLGAARIAPAASTLHEVDRQGRADVAGDQRLLDLVPLRPLAGAGPEERPEPRHEVAPGPFQAVLECRFRIRLCAGLRGD